MMIRFLSWLKANLVPILMVASVLMAVGAVRGWTKAAHFEGVAETHEARAEAESARADSIQAIRLEERRADSIRTAALKDSADARVARAEEARQREAEARERRERARARAAASASDLRETLTPAQVPLFERYVEDRDVEVATLESELGSVRTRLDEAETENASLWVVVEAKDALYGIAVEELAAKDVTIASLESANEALRQANSAGGFLPDFGSLTSPVYIAIGAVGGYVIAEVR